MQKEIAGLITGKGEGEKFQLKWGLITLNLEIKLLTTEQVIKIASIVSSVKQFQLDENKEIFPAFVENVADVKYIVKAIAIATNSRFKKIVELALLDLPLKDIQTLWDLVRVQSDPTRFFFIMASTKGGIAQILKPKDQLPEEKQSSES